MLQLHVKGSDELTVYIGKDFFTPISYCAYILICAPDSDGSTEENNICEGSTFLDEMVLGGSFDNIFCLYMYTLNINVMRRVLFSFYLFTPYDLFQQTFLYQTLKININCQGSSSSSYNQQNRLINTQELTDNIIWIRTYPR